MHNGFNLVCITSSAIQSGINFFVELKLLKERGTENEYLEQLHNKCTNQNTSQTG